MPRFKVKKRVLPPPADEYAYVEQVGPNAWRVGDEDGEVLTAQDVIERYQAQSTADADLLAADAFAAHEARAGAAAEEPPDPPKAGE